MCGGCYFTCTDFTWWLLKFVVFCWYTCVTDYSHFISCTCRYLHWLVTDVNGTSLHQMNLRNVSSSSVVVVASRVRRQTNQIASLNLSSALLLDPHNGNLLLSDLDTGDIVSCNVSNGACNVLVSPGSVQPQQNCGGTGMYV